MKYSKWPRSLPAVHSTPPANCGAASMATSPAFAFPLFRCIASQAAFLKELKPESMGLVFRPIKSEQLAAAHGGTDFAMFFVMFSFFLIAAAALLVAMLFRLNIEQSAPTAGIDAGSWITLMRAATTGALAGD